MTYSNDPHPSVYAHVPSPLPNIDFPLPYWINKLADWIIVGCLDPDLAYAALLVPAAMKMAWTVATPGTKQLVEMATGRSWICGTKQIMSSVQQGEQIAASDSGRFIYGLMKGLDIQAYYAFMLSTGAQGVVDFGSFAKKFQRVCDGTNSKYRGLIPFGGWPAPWPDWQAGPAYSNSDGDNIGDLLTIQVGEIGAWIAWCNFTDLYGTGGVVCSLRIVDQDTGQVHDMDTVNNMFSISNYAVVRFFTSEGRATRITNLRLEFFVNEAVGSRVVTYRGGCYKRAWNPDAGSAPPYWNVKTMIKENQEARAGGV